MSKKQSGNKVPLTDGLKSKKTSGNVLISKSFKKKYYQLTDLYEDEKMIRFKIRDSQFVIIKNSIHTISQDSIKLVKHFATVLFDHRPLSSLVDKELFHTNLPIKIEIKQLPTSKEIYLAIKRSEVDGGEVLYAAIKFSTQSKTLAKYVDYSEMSLLKNDIHSVIERVKSIVTIKNADILKCFVDFEFLVETRLYENRLFFFDRNVDSRLTVIKSYKDALSLSPLCFNFIGLKRSGDQIKIKQEKRYTFSDIVDMDDIIDQFKEIGKTLKNYNSLKDKGIRPPYGVLLIGEPGCGKTFVTNAFINEFGLSCYVYSPSSELESLKDTVKDVFDRARRNKPSVVLIDELDKIKITNELFTEMNGSIQNSGVVVIASVNSLNGIHPALLRPGRFDRKIFFSPLSNRSKSKILTAKLYEANVVFEFDFNHVIDLMGKISVAYIDAYVNEARIKMEVHNEPTLTESRLISVIDFVNHGYVRPEPLSDEAFNQICIHEAGHAVVAIVLYGVDVITKIDCRRSSMSNGYVQLKQIEGKLETKEDYVKAIKIGLGGIIAEDLFAGSLSVGSTSDLEKVRKMCELMITRFGFSNLSSITNIMFSTMSSVGTEVSKNFVIEESKKLIESAEDEIRNMLKEKQAIHSRIVECLTKEKVLFTEDIRMIVAADFQDVASYSMKKGELYASNS